MVHMGKQVRWNSDIRISVPVLVSVCRSIEYNAFDVAYQPPMLTTYHN